MTKKKLLIIITIALFALPVLGILANKVQRKAAYLTQPRVGTTMMGRTGSTPMGRPADVYVSNDAAEITSTVSESMPAQKTMMPMPPMTGGGFTSGQPRTIVKNASLGLVVKDTRHAVDQIQSIVKEQTGVVTSSNIYETEYNSGQIRADLVVRVPVDKLEDTTVKMKAVAEKVSIDTVTADDRTEQKVDLEAQLKNLRATEEQLLAIMKQAKTVEETLQVQREVTTTRNQIERLQAQLDNLTGDAAMSTLTVSISTKESELPVIDPNQRGFKDELKITLRDTVALYREIIMLGVRLLILTMPVLVVGLIGFVFYKNTHQNTRPTKK